MTPRLAAAAVVGDYLAKPRQAARITDHEEHHISPDIGSGGFHRRMW